MILPDLTELSLVAVLERGVPNQECIAISVKETVDLSQFGLLVGVMNPNGLAVPAQDYFFWFGSAIVSAGDWIFVNTGDGEPRLRKSTDQQFHVYTLFWKRPRTIFANSNVVPLLISMGAVDVMSPPKDRPQEIQKPAAIGRS